MASLSALRQLGSIDACQRLIVPQYRGAGLGAFREFIFSRDWGHQPARCGRSKSFAQVCVFLLDQQRSCGGSGIPRVQCELTDNYIGGQDNGGFGDVIGATNPFGITSVDVTRPDANTLNITINTFYAGAPDNHNSGAPNTFGTGYGSLFLSKGAASTWATFGADSVGDTYSSHVGFWSYAVTVNDNNGTLTGGLYSTGSTSSDTAHTYNATGVVQNYTTSTDGTIVMANVNGNPVSYPNPGNPNDYFRQGQAVQYDPFNGQSVMIGTSVLESIVAPNGGNPGQIIFTITDNGFFDDSLALAWAMTCGNDVIIAEIPVTITTHQDFNAITGCAATVWHRPRRVGSAWLAQEAEGRAGRLIKIQDRIAERPP